LPDQDVRQIMTSVNEWASPSNISSATAAAMAASLEERARCPDQQQVNAALGQALNPKPGGRWLEVGCGSGVLCRLLAPQIMPGGQMYGSDISFEILEVARQLAGEAGLAETVVFEVGGAERLPFASDTFDGAFAARLLLHVSNPEAVISEMARVTKPFGWVTAMDWDFETVAVDHSNRELTRRLLHWRTDHEGGDNWSGRKLWRYMIRAGLTNLTLHPVLSVAQNETDSLYQSLWKAAQVACAGGAITPEEEFHWKAELKAKMAANQFFASIVYYIVRGQRA
jgi:ubiquinone/menaquinone biosynthesis C-methylase UbiE